MKKHVRSAIWFTVALSFCVFTMTIFSTVKGAPRWGWYFTVAASLMQLLGLVYYMHSDWKKEKSRLLKTGLVLLKLSSLGVALLLGFAVYIIATQYHNYVPATKEGESRKNITVETTDLLYVMYPEYDTVRFVCENRPSRSDRSVTFCGAATFQQRYNPAFTHAELPGIHVVEGKLYRGYELENLGAFTFYDGAFRFSGTEDAEEALLTAAERGGWGFQQFVVIDNGEIVDRNISSEYRCYRVLAELKGRLCVIDSAKQIYYTDFVRALKELGVTDALFMDMGSGWNYSWYRDNDGKARTLIGLPWPFSHNWIAFCKDEER